MTDLLSGIKFRSPPIAVISSDWHVALNAWKKYPEIRGDAEFSLSQIVDISTALNVPLIAAGDLFDVKNPDSYTVNVTARQMKRMLEANLPVFYVQGQHEMASPTWFSLFEGCKHVHDKTFEISGIKFYGYDYFLPKSFDDSYVRFKPADVLVTHQVWSELLPRHGQIHCCSYSLIAQNNTYKAIISGDFHSHFTTNIENTSCTFVSPGSICLQDMNEPANKSVWVMTENYEFISVPIKSRKVISANIKSDNDLNTVVSMSSGLSEDTDIPNGIGKPILRIKYNTDIKNVFAAVTNAYKGKAHLDFKPIIDEVEEEPVDVQDISIKSSSADEAFCESLQHFFPGDNRGSNDVIRLWKTNTLDELRGEITSIVDEIKINNSKS